MVSGLWTDEIYMDVYIYIYIYIYIYGYIFAKFYLSCFCIILQNGVMVNTATLLVL